MSIIFHFDCHVTENFQNLVFLFDNSKQNFLADSWIHGQEFWNSEWQRETELMGGNHFGSDFPFNQSANIPSFRLETQTRSNSVTPPHNQRTSKRNDFNSRYNRGHYRARSRRHILLTEELQKCLKEKKRKGLRVRTLDFEFNK